MMEDLTERTADKGETRSARPTVWADPTDPRPREGLRADTAMRTMTATVQVRHPFHPRADS